MRSILLATTALSLGTFLPLTAPAQNIGNVAAVNRDMAGTPPTADRRLLQLGNNVVRNERIETSDEGAGQLMFIDQTSLTVSPNTDIRLDEYVYDPATDTGDVALTMTRGALRFIGGRISKNRRALVRTPTATIGIRGGMVLLEVEEGVTKVTHLAGESTTVVSFGDNDGDGVDDGPAPGEELEQFLSGGDVPAAEQVTLSRTSSTATTGEPQQDGQPTEVQFTGLTDSSELEEVFGGFEGNQDGGTESPPTDADIEQQTQPIAQINSEVPGGQNTQPVSTTGESSEGIRSDSEPQELPPQELETTPSQDTAIENETDPDTGDLALLPEGGAFFVPGVGLDAFTSITEGSIIGTTADGQTVTLNVPASATDLLATNPFTGGSFFAQTRFPNSGFFLIESGQAVSSELGELTGIGFADFDNEFIIAGVENEFEEPALIFFGTNTDNQNGFFTSDPTAPAGANSITQYVIEAELDNPNDTSTDLLAIISNGGTDASDGRAIFAEVLIEAGQGGQTSELSVLAAPLVRR
ncbi:MAG: FecR family protein, partial [Pseudomonadota bacterium]